MKKAELRNCSGTRSAVSTFTTEHRDTEKTQVWKTKMHRLPRWLCDSVVKEVHFYVAWMRAAEAGVIPSRR